MKVSSAPTAASAAAPSPVPQTGSQQARPQDRVEAGAGDRSSFPGYEPRSSSAPRALAHDTPDQPETTRAGEPSPRAEGGHRPEPQAPEPPGATCPESPGGTCPPRGRSPVSACRDQPRRPRAARAFPASIEWLKTRELGAHPAPLRSTPDGGGRAGRGPTGQPVACGPPGAELTGSPGPAGAAGERPLRSQARLAPPSARACGPWAPARARSDLCHHKDPDRGEQQPPMRATDSDRGG